MIIAIRSSAPTDASIPGGPHAAAGRRFRHTHGIWGGSCVPDGARGRGCRSGRTGARRSPTPTGVTCVFLAGDEVRVDADQPETPPPLRSSRGWGPTRFVLTFRCAARRPEINVERLLVLPPTLLPRRPYSLVGAVSRPLRSYQWLARMVDPRGAV